MTEGGIFDEIGEEFTGVAETAIHGGTALGHAAAGDWEGAADGSLHMSESAIGVATGGVSELLEAGYDALRPEGTPEAHEALHHVTQSAGEAVGDGMFALVGDEHAHASAVDFDNGDYLGGLGEMASGAAETVGGAIEDAASSVYDQAAEALDEIF